VYVGNIILHFGIKEGK